MSCMRCGRANRVTSVSGSPADGSIGPPKPRLGEIRDRTRFVSFGYQMCISSGMTRSRANPIRTGSIYAIRRGTRSEINRRYGSNSANGSRLINRLSLSALFCAGDYAASGSRSWNLPTKQLEAWYEGVSVAVQCGKPFLSASGNHDNEKRHARMVHLQLRSEYWP